MESIIQRYKITLEYDGSNYCGFQKQNLSSQKSVEETLTNAIKKFSNSEVEIFASGRTDSGVHALQQVVHFDLNKKLSSHQIIMGINFYLKEEEIVVTDCELTEQDFHARFSAKLRYYRYVILNRKAPAVIDKNRVWHVGGKILDISSMKKSAEFLVGCHDFSSFRDSECQASSPVRTINEIKIFQEHEKIIIEVSAKSFLHHMVRNIVGTLVYVGKGKIEVQDMKKILEAKNRSYSGPNAPACGLFFLKTDY